MSILIEELYSDKECEIIKEFFQEDSLKKTILNAIGTKIVIEKDKILTSKPLDILYLICLTSKFASSDEECHAIAITVYQYFDKPKFILPLLTEDHGLVFASKTLIALSFHSKAMEHRWKHHGAPAPAFYRRISKATFQSAGQTNIANHHEQWESFLGEMFV